MSSKNDSAATVDDTLTLSLSIYMPVLGVCLILYEVARKKYRKAYNPKAFDETRKNDIVERDDLVGYFGWIKELMSIKDDEFIANCGLDSLVYVRFLRLGLKVSFCCLACAILLLPVYGTENPYDYKGSTVNQLSIGNLKSKSSRMWATTITMYIVSFYTMYLLREEYMAYIPRRQQYLSKLGPSQYTMVIEDLPENLQSEAALYDYMKFLFPDTLHSVAIVLEVGNIEKLIQKRDALVPKLEHAVAMLASSGKRPCHKSGGICCMGGQKVDTIRTYEQELKVLNNEIATCVEDIRQKHVNFEEEVQKSIDEGGSDLKFSTPRPTDDFDVSSDVYHPLDNEQSSTNQGANGWLNKLAVNRKVNRPCGFVSFRSLRSAMVAQQVLQSSKPFEMVARSAPNPEDIYWPNLGLVHTKREVGNLLSTLATYTLIIFWSVPVIFVTTFSSVNNLRKKVSFLDTLIRDHPWVGKFLEQLGPLGLIILMALLPVILTIFCKWEAHISSSALEGSLFNKLSVFQIFQVFLVASIAGTLSNSISDILKNPGSAPGLLGQYIPNQATFFMNFILIAACVGFMLELLRVVDIVKGFIYDKFAPKLTERERNSPWLGLQPVTRPGKLDMPSSLAGHCLVLVLVFCYSLIAPLLSFFGVLYFFIAMNVYRRQLLYVYDFMDDGGVFWRQMYNLIIAGLILGQITVLGVVSLNQGASQVTFFVIILLITLIFHFHILSGYPTASKHLAMNACVRLDKERKECDYSFLNDAYRQDALKAVDIDVRASEYLVFDASNADKEEALIQ